jgi:two-component system response regulator HydG
VSPRVLPWWVVWGTPVLAAYAVMELLSRTDGLDALSWALLTAAAAFALVPWSLSRKEDAARDAPSGPPLVAALGALASLHAVAVAAPAQSLFLEASAAALPGALGAITTLLALRAPEPPRALSRVAGLGVLLGALSIVAAVLGLLVTLAPFELDGETVVLPGALLEVGLGVLLSGLLVAVVLRAVRGRLGSGPEELAQSALALLGCVVALVAILGTGVLARLLPSASPLSLHLSHDVLRTGWLLADVALVGGHVALVRGVKPARAASMVRAALSAVFTYAIVLGGLVLVVDAFGRAGWLAWAFALAVGLPVALLVHRLTERAVFYVLAPDRGRLLLAIEAARSKLEGVRSLEDLGQAVLPPLRVASRSSEARALILVAVPSCEVSVDAASVAHVAAVESSPAVMNRLRERPGEVLLRAPLEALVVRRPELRPLVDSLERHDALAVVALVDLQEIEGALVIPRGRRRAAVTLEEMHAMDRLGASVSGVVAALSAERRAQERAGAAVLGVQKLEERIETLEDENAALRADAAALKAGASVDRFSHPVVAYGPEMRAFVQRAEQVATLDAPVLLRAEPGTALEPIGQLLHAGSPRRDGPLVVADALTIQPGRAMAALFGSAESVDGEGAHPGWLRLAQGGTLLLLDAPALPLAAQTALEDAIASRSLRGAGSASSVPLDVRVVLTTRVELAPLLAASAFDGELAKRVEPLTLVVPSLSARREDLRSLVLLAIDRGCRALGKATVGIEEEALVALLAYPWSVGTRELEDVVERAVGRAAGTRITVADLGLREVPAPSDAAEADAWIGSYTDLETRILEKALERANGNKSEAARALGLKRTTFLDKLRRAGLERPTSPPPGEPLVEPDA